LIVFSARKQDTAKDAVAVGLVAWTLVMASGAVRTFRRG
jgi:hypothetical protein